MSPPTTRELGLPKDRAWDPSTQQEVSTPVLENTLLRGGRVPGQWWGGSSGWRSPLSQPHLRPHPYPLWVWLPGVQWPLHGPEDGLGLPPKVVGLHTLVQAGSAGAGSGGTRGPTAGPQTKVAWCGLALGLVGLSGTGLRPGSSDTGGLRAADLQGPAHTPGSLQPSPGAEPVTRSTSMIVLTGRPPLPWAPPPVTGRRETSSPGCPQPCRRPWQAPPPSCLAQSLGVGGVPQIPKCTPEATTPARSLSAR